MLLEMRIGNLALAADVSLPLGPGFTVITGETGAGKSMIAGALGLLGGGKGDRELVRSGEELAYVEGVFDLSGQPTVRAASVRLGLPIGDDDLLVIRRELRREGRSRVLINGLVSSLAVLERLGPSLLAVQSQDQQRELSTSDYPRELLDEALALGERRGRVATALTALREAADRLHAREQEIALAREQLDLWRYQHDELRAAALRDDELPELSSQIAMKRHAHALQDAAAVALEHLAEGEAPACTSLGAAQAALTPHADKSARLADALASLAIAADQAADAAHALSRFLDQIDLDPRGLDELESRKALYEDLQRKYRQDVAGLVALAERLAERIGRQERATADVDALQAEVARCRTALATATADLRSARESGAARVAKQALAIIRPLALPNLELDFRVSATRDPGGEVTLDGQVCRVESHGADRVELIARTNPGESRGPVGSLASGGERSRIHLGLTVLLQGEGDGPPVRLFDEVDAGLGMDAAAPVALLLRQLARRSQVLCITHLPTMAVHADQHVVVTKRVSAGRTSLQVRVLTPAERVGEIARLLGGEGYGGDDHQAQLAYAQELLAAGGATAGA